MDKRYVKKDGSYVWIELRAFLVRDVAGEPSCFITAVEYIDERKREELWPCARSLIRAEEVLALLGEGRTNPKIAGRLVIRASTAKFHVQHIVKKLGVADRKQAAEYGSKIGPPSRASGNGARNGRPRS